MTGTFIHIDKKVVKHRTLIDYFCRCTFHIDVLYRYSLFLTPLAHIWLIGSKFRPLWSVDFSGSWLSSLASFLCKGADLHKLPYSEKCNYGLDKLHYIICQATGRRALLWNEFKYKSWYTHRIFSHFYRRCRRLLLLKSLFDNSPLLSFHYYYDEILIFEYAAALRVIRQQRLLMIYASFHHIAERNTPSLT